MRTQGLPNVCEHVSKTLQHCKAGYHVPPVIPTKKLAFINKTGVADIPSTVTSVCISIVVEASSHVEKSMSVIEPDIVLRNLDAQVRAGRPP
jgi:hypothetical protein